VGAFAPAGGEHVGKAAEGRKMGLGLLKIHHGFWVQIFLADSFSGLKLIVCNPSSVLLLCQGEIPSDLSPACDVGCGAVCGT
jgi:hypothetical protein